MASRAPSWYRNQPPPASRTFQAPTRSATSGSYISPPNYVASRPPPASGQHLPTAQHLPWAGVAAPAPADQLSMSLRQVPGFQPPPNATKLGGPTLGQVANLGISSFARGPATTTHPTQASSTTTQKNRSWVPDPSAAPPMAPGVPLVPPSLGFEWGGLATTDFLSKTVPSNPAPALGVDWLSSNFKQLDIEEKSAPEPYAVAAPVAALGTLNLAMPSARPTTPRAAVRPCREGCHLRFNTGSSSRQHPAKQASGIPNADATEESPILLGVCDGVSGCTKLGISPDLLPHELLSACRNKCKNWVPKATALKVDDGIWLTNLMEDAYDSTTAMGATTMLLAAITESGSVLTANIGDCTLVVLRVVPPSQGSSRLQVVLKTKPTRYEATKPVQVQRLPHMPVERTHTVIKGSKLESCPVQSGDYVVMGSDGLFDNLQDEDILRLVERHCPMDRAAPTATLNEAAAALVNTAIARAQPNAKREPQQKQWPPWHTGSESVEDKINPDDTTALVAAVVEVPDIDEYERWFWRSRGIQQPYQDHPLPRAARNSSVPPAPKAASVKVPQNSGPGSRNRARSYEPNGAPPSPEKPMQAGSPQRKPPSPEKPLQDCTNMQAGSAEQPPACPGPREDATQLRVEHQNDSPSNTRMPSFKGKGGGKGAKGQHRKGDECVQEATLASGAPGAPDWWSKMAVPGKAAPAAPLQQGANGQLAAQAARTQEAHPALDDDGRPRLTSTILRAHEVKMATAESIARYSNANRGNRPVPASWRRPAPIPEQQPVSRSADNCVVS